MRHDKSTALDWIIFGPGMIALWTLVVVFIVIPVCLHHRWTRT